MNKGLQNKRRVLITNADTDIGIATARAFSHRGDALILAARDEAAREHMLASLGPDHLIIRLPLDDEEAISAHIAQCIKDAGQIDVLVCCDDHSKMDQGSSLSLTESDFRQTTISRFDSRFVLTREVGKAMLEHGSGAIIHVLQHAALAGSVAKCITESAVLGFMRAQACEWALSGIRVNAVIAGCVSDDDADRLPIPLGRAGKPEEVANVVAHIASATYTTGATIPVDGGLEAYGACALGTNKPGVLVPSASASSPVVLVTGGASGIGAAIVENFIRQGAKVAVFDRNLDQMAKLPENCLAIAGDVLDEQAVTAAVKTIEERLGPITQLANNAGIADVWSPTIEQKLADFRHVHEVNMLGAFIVARTVANRMAEHGTGGSIVNLSSIVATGGMPRRNAYCGAKAGISMMTKTLACDWARFGIRVNAVAPGSIATPGVQALEKDGRANFREMRRRVPMGRFGTPAEIAEAVSFLLSDEASYMNGTVYMADGGYSVFGAAGPAADVD